MIRAVQQKSARYAARSFPGHVRLLCNNSLIVTPERPKLRVQREKNSVLDSVDFIGKEVLEEALNQKRARVYDPNWKPHANKSPVTDLTRFLRAAISSSGPITVHRYMQECLGNVKYGYYKRKHEIFGSKGDFLTSPEISQLFGEMMGVWCVNTWEQMGSPKKINIVELGPGKGTLMKDLVRASKTFPGFKDAIHIHLVETSAVLRKKQQKALDVKNVKEIKPPRPSKIVTPENPIPEQQKPGEYVLRDIMYTGKSKHGFQVSWYSTFEQVPKGKALVIANEFFDALPVHQFVFTERGWCEKMVDIDEADETDHHFQFVLSDGPTVASRVFLRDDETNKPKLNDAIEVCPEAMSVAQAIGKRISKQGGAAVLIDYGDMGAPASSLQGLRKHEFVHVLREPGLVDLTCHVNFKVLGIILKNAGCQVFDLVTQSYFLQGSGVESRAGTLLEQCKTEEETEKFKSAAHRVVDVDKMGGHYKVLGCASKGMNTPVGFWKPNVVK